MPKPYARWIVDASDAGVRLDKYLAAPDRLGSRAKAFAAIERGKVFVDDREAGIPDASSILTAGQAVRVWTDRPGSARAPRRATTFRDLTILYEDDDVVVVNKPAGLLTVPLERRAGSPSVLEELAAYLRPFGKRRPLAVHRIDEDTSGLVLFAKNPRAQGILQAQFKRREPARVYRALVYGHPDPSAGVWRDRIVWDEKVLIQKRARTSGGTEAVSEYRVLERFGDASLLEIRLVTGRRNQIRIQASLHGCPLIGEKRYTPDARPARPIRFPRHALHAFQLTFRHPDGRALTFESPPPADFAELLSRLR